MERMLAWVFEAGGLMEEMGNMEGAGGKVLFL